MELCKLACFPSTPPLVQPCYRTNTDTPPLQQARRRPRRRRFLPTLPRCSEQHQARSFAIAPDTALPVS
eukprot:2132398-Rhodomonas_salina.1